MNTIIFYDDTGLDTCKTKVVLADIRSLLNQTDEPKRSALFLDAKPNLVGCAEGVPPSAIVIKTGGEYKWNPIHDPECQPEDLAWRVIAVYENLMGTAVDELNRETMFQLLTSSIGLHRLVYGYSTLNDVVNVLQYDEKSITDIYNADWYKIDYCEMEYLLFRRDLAKHYRYLINSFSTPGRADAVNTLVSLLEIFTREDIAATFCPVQQDINFSTDDAIKDGKVVILYATTSGALPQILGVLMKLSYQTSVIALESSSALVMNDYQDFITATDQEFFRLAPGCTTICTAPGRESLSAKVGEERTNKILSIFYR